MPRARAPATSDASPRTPGLFTTRSIACAASLLASEMDFDALRAEPSRIQRLVRVEADDRRTDVHKRVRCSRSGPRETDDEHAPAA